MESLSDVAVPLRCCSHFQQGCPKTTLSPMGCDAVCHQGGQSNSCMERIDWVTKNVFSGLGSGQALASLFKADQNL